MKLKKGGIESIIAIVIIVAIVMMLIYVSVIPIANESEKLTDTGVEALTGLGTIIDPGYSDPG